MTLNETIMTPVWLVTLTREDVIQLDKCSRNHYDWTCKRLCEPGGMIYGFMNCVCEPVDRDSFETSLVFRDVDLLCKVVENSHLLGYNRDLFSSLYALLRSTTRG